jgi:small GTP-binding protein
MSSEKVAGNGKDNEMEMIQDEIRKTPYHKATQAHIGRLKAKLARLKSESEQQKEPGKGKASGFAVKKSGDATVLLVGFPSVGKSTLINRLTNAESKTAEYDFTTLDVIPGMLEYNGAKIQLLDIPGMILGASKGKGKGRQILSVVRNADLIIILIDQARQLLSVKKELQTAGFRLDQRKPDVKIVKKFSGGLNINLAVKKPALDVATVRSVLGEFKIHNADVIIRENVTVDQLIDSLTKNRIYVPSLVVFNKIDRMGDSDLNGIGKTLKTPKGAKEIGGPVFISARLGKNLDVLCRAIWDKLGLIRVYMKRPGKEPDMAEPLIMKAGCTIMDVAGKILKSDAKSMKHARIWGRGAKFGGQQVGRGHMLQDMDVVELHA